MLWKEPALVHFLPFVMGRVVVVEVVVVGEAIADGSRRPHYQVPCKHLYM